MNELDFLPVAYARPVRTIATKPAPTATAPEEPKPVEAVAETAAEGGHETTATAETGAEAGAHEGGLEIQPSTIAFQALNFVLLVVVLYLILYKPMLKLLADREKRIRDGVENAEKAEGMLKESNIIRQDMIKKANADSQQILEKARISGEEIKTGLVTDAHKEAGAIIKSGQNLIEMEKAKTAQELKGMAVNLIVNATEKVLREKLDADRDRKLINESLQGI
jgi:F-type H+-transporting ATPase subunit b